MTFSFHPEASAEFEGAVAYYEERQTGLGLDLALEVQAAIQNIVAFPHAWPVIEGEIRRCLVHRFPYGILYAIEPTEIWVLAVMHLRRDPDYWKHRRQA
jgi:plasmid stabilization system protein ParE